MSGETQLAVPIKVKVANGDILHCTSQIEQVAWSSSGYQFLADMKVLSLSSYDMILGLDWLEHFSPMQVHWKHKWLFVPYRGSTAILWGMLDEIPEGAIVRVCSVQTQPSETPCFSATRYTIVDRCFC